MEYPEVAKPTINNLFLKLTWSSFVLTSFLVVVAAVSHAVS